MFLCGSPEHSLHRRAFLRGSLAGMTAAMSFGGVGVSAGEPAAAALKQRGRKVIFVWLAGGSSQFETWDPKPGRETGGPFRTIATAIPGYHVCELMPKLAATQHRPAEAPAPSANGKAGAGPRKSAKTRAAIALSTKEPPKVSAALPRAISSCVSPVSRIQALPNKTGEYHIPPRRKLDAAATSTAQTLISDIALPLRESSMGSRPHPERRRHAQP